jgi:predicted nucleotidyltransferase
LSEQDKILSQIKFSIEKEDNSAEIILFGSRARGEGLNDAKLLA